MRKNKFVMSYSDLFRVSIDPRVKPEGDRKECVIEGDRKECVAKGDERWKNVPECDNFFKVMPRFGTNCHGIFELDNNKLSLRGEHLCLTWQSQQNKKISRDAYVNPMGFLSMTKDRIGRSLDLAYRLGGMTKDKLISRGAHVGTLSLLSMTIFLLSSVAKAECTPTPDCANIGYTETSCDGKFTRCPFDTSKLFCIPCDSAYRYTCEGNYTISPSGNACNGKYVSCECVAGASLIDRTCECDTSCSIGNIYYSDGSCSSCLDNSKTPVGIFIRSSRLIVAINIPNITWANDYLDISNLTNYSSAAVALQDFNGYNNTNSIISYYGTSISPSTNAAAYCYNYTPVGFESSNHQWYLPASGELIAFLYENYNKVKATWNILGTTISNEWFWSSSENNQHNAWRSYMLWGSTGERAKAGDTSSVACFLNIS